MNLVVALIVSSLILRVVDRWYYRDHDRVLRTLRLLPPEQSLPSGRLLPLDPLLCWFPFIWVWLDIAAALVFGHLVENLLVWLVVALVVGGRFRALQEIAHTAVHSGLCRSRSYQWAIADFFVSWPLFRPDVAHRYIGHVVEHHAHTNDPDSDPNIKRFAAIGIVPGISLSTWRNLMWFPLSVAGFIETGRNLAIAVAQKNISKWLLPLRLSVASGFVGAVYAVSGLEGLLFGYLFPLVTVYPLYSWISVLAEHRWFVRCEETDRRSRECVQGRPTDRMNVILKHMIFPMSDHYHLAHSLYPALRWNHLAAVDRALKQSDDRYVRYASVGLFRQSGSTPTALSELRHRLVAEDPDLAEWAKTLTSVRSIPKSIAV